MTSTVTYEVQCERPIADEWAICTTYGRASIADATERLTELQKIWPGQRFRIVKVTEMREVIGE